METPVEVLRIEIAKLALAPGEVLLVKLPKSMDRPDVWRQVNIHLAATFPDNKVLLATQDIDFTVIALEPAPAS